MTRWALALFVAAAGGCASGPARRAPPPLAAVSVPWNGGSAGGQVAAVAELGDAMVLVGDASATILVGGGVVLVDRSAAAWTWAGTIAAPDGAGTWLVATTADGQLRRLRARASLEPVSDRFGLARDRVRAACSAGPRATVFLLDTGLALSDGAHVHRIDGAFTSVACGPNELAATTAAGVRLLGPSGGDRFLSLASPIVTFTAHGRLIAASGTHLFAAAPSGELVRVHETSARIDALASSGDAAWFAAAGKLGFFDGAVVSETPEPCLAVGTTLTSSQSGHVWAISKDGIARFARPSASPQDGAWQTTIAPLFQRSCARCHGPAGSSGVDLSTATAWSSSRGDLRSRVVEKRDMPPAGAAFTDEDRETVRRFVSAP